MYIEQDTMKEIGAIEAGAEAEVEPKAEAKTGKGAGLETARL